MGKSNYNRNNGGNRSGGKDDKKKIDYVLDPRLTFINPYNFVSLPKTPNNKTDSSKEKGTFSGVLHCKLVTKTPLAIPDTDSVKVEEDDHNVYEFYKVNGKYAIPGSSIRGCIRSLYEMATDSCFSTMQDEQFISSRVIPVNAYTAGILMRENGIWKLYKADRYKLKTSASDLYIEKINTASEPKGEIVIEDNNNSKLRFKMGDYVCFQEKYHKVTAMRHYNKDASVPSGWKRGYVFAGESMPKKKFFQSVFVFEGESKEKSLVNCATDELIRAIHGLEHSVREYQDTTINKKLSEKKHTGYLCYERCKAAGVIPLWYKKENGKYYLSMASIGRRVNDKTVNEMVDGRIPCKSRKQVCPACSLFGMERGEGIGSKLRFTDAYCAGFEMKKSIVLDELGTPRTGYEPFYSPNGEGTIGGRKFYWHNVKGAENLIKKSDFNKKINRNATVEVISSDAGFLFDVYYDNVTKKQLQELKWIITLGENSLNGHLCQKLGHGKPLGLGSVKIVVEADECRSFSIEEGYKIEKNMCEIIDNPFDSFLTDQIRIICDLYTMKDENVRYPYIQKDKEIVASVNAKASHQWFSKNKNREQDKQLLHPIGTVESSDIIAKNKLIAYKLIEKAKE